MCFLKISIFVLNGGWDQYITKMSEFINHEDHTWMQFLLKNIFHYLLRFSRY